MATRILDFVVRAAQWWMRAMWRPPGVIGAALRLRCAGQTQRIRP